MSEQRPQHTLEEVQAKFRYLRTSAESVLLISLKKHNIKIDDQMLEKMLDAGIVSIPESLFENGLDGIGFELRYTEEGFLTSLRITDSDNE